ncbi:MAG: hypothetical protein OXH96_10435 [Spirochaetaceae bacterium]|nr:hypothetical protein [Spirochaetaceae bacterium]
MYRKKLSIVRRVISSPAEALPYWQHGIEAVVKDPGIRSIFWVAMYSGMRRGEILTLRLERRSASRTGVERRSPTRATPNRRRHGDPAHPCTHRRWPPGAERGRLSRGDRC